MGINKKIEGIREKREQYKRDINLFAKEICLINPEPQQQKAFDLFLKTGRLAVKAGHGVGKTTLITIILFHHLYCYNNSIIACTAPTKHQLSDILWTEAARFMARSKILNYFFIHTATKIMVRGAEKTWYAVAIPSSNPDSLAGFHEKNLLFLLDEGFGIKESAFPVIEGALTGKDNKVVAIGNPTRISGFFYNLFRNPNGWSTATFSCLDSKLVDPSFPKRIAQRFGESSNIYRVRVLGQFPTGEDDNIIDVDIVDGAMKREAPLLALQDREAGLDIARYGGDRTELYVRYGLEIVDHVEILSSDLTEVQGVSIQMIKKHGLSAFKIDVSGMGAGVVDNLISSCDEEGIDCDIIGIANNQRANDSDKYENAGTEMYFDLKETLKSAKITADDELLGELTTRKYKINRTSGRLQIVDKEQLRKDMKRQGVQGFKSPDKADALALCFYQSQNVNQTEAEVFFSSAYKDF